MYEDEGFSPPATDTKIFGVCDLIISFTAAITLYHDFTGAFP